MKRTIRFKLFSFSLFLVIFTYFSITVPLYLLAKQEMKAASQVRVEIALSILTEDAQDIISTHNSLIGDLFRQVTAIPWELTWYNRNKNRMAFFSDPTYSSYITTIGNEFSRFSHFVSADRLMLYGADKRLLITYLNGEGEDFAGAYVVNRNNKNTFLSTFDYSKSLITRKPLPEEPLPEGLKPYYEGEIPDFSLSSYYQRGNRIGIRITYPVFHQDSKVGVLVLETPYTQTMVDDYARLSQTEVNIFARNSWSVGTLPALKHAGGDIFGTIDPEPGSRGSDQKTIEVISARLDEEEYYMGVYPLPGSGRESAGFVTFHLSKQKDTIEIRRILNIILLISLIVLLIAFFIILTATRNTLGSIRKLTDSTSSIANGNLDLEIDISGNDEHGLLAQAVSKMQSAIKEQILQLKSEISLHKQTAKNLEESQQKLAATLRSIGDCVITCNNEGCVQSLNRSAEKMTGWSTEEAAGLPVEEVFRVVHKLTRRDAENPVRKVLQSGRTAAPVKDTSLIDRRGNEYRISDSCSPISDASGFVFGAVLVFRDMTEEYALQERFRQSQKMDAVGQLAGGVAHDFNNMLGGIMGAADMMQSRAGDHPEVARFLPLIIESAERSADLASKLLAFSRKQTPGTMIIDIHDVIVETVSLLENTIDKRINVSLDLTSENSLATGDKAQLQSVFLNLAINASHAMPDGGELSFRSKQTGLTRAYCEASAFDLSPGEYLEINVKDTGCGIDSEDLPRIFEPFFTTKTSGKGTGLGLAAAYGTVCQHNGAINVYSQLGEGTSFQVLFPLSGDTLAETEPVTASVRGEGLILLVDDEAVMRITGEAILEDLGYDLLLAENGKQALSLFRKRAKEIDLVILDMIMPEMNGQDCFNEIRKIEPSVPVIMASGFMENDDLGELKNRGLSDFIHKPYRGLELSRAVSDTIRKK